jgi:hypothetical protein
MKVLLHIGQSKTGTSAIQKYLTLNRIRLRDMGILYPSVLIGGLPVDLGNHNTVVDALVGRRSYPGYAAHQYFDQFFGEAKRFRADLLILSAEHFFGGEPRIWDVPNEKIYFDRYRNKLRVLARYLSGHDVTLLVYLRPQVDWLASAISQTIRVERLITDRPIYRDDWQFYEMAKPVLRYASLLDAWCECLRPRKVKVIPYDNKNLRKRNSVVDFLYRTGLDNANLSHGCENQRINPSLSREYIEVKKLLNRASRRKAEERVIIACLERLSANYGRAIPYRLSAELIHEVESFAAPENDRLNERYLEGSVRLHAASEMAAAKDPEEVSDDDIAQAKILFEKEYASLRMRIRLVDYAMRACLRTYVKPMHSAFHQLKRICMAYAYQK